MPKSKNFNSLCLSNKPISVNKENPLETINLKGEKKLLNNNKKIMKWSGADGADGLHNLKKVTNK